MELAESSLLMPAGLAESVSNTDLKQKHCASNDAQDIEYSVENAPPIYLTIVLAFQHYISMFIATLTVPFLLAPKLCMDDDNIGKSEVIGTLFVASGIVTLIQNIFGIRLPVVQAGTFALLAPTIAFFSLPEWECPSNIVKLGQNMTNASLSNVTWIEIGSSAHRDIWMGRLRVVQGSLMVASLFEAILGLTGAIGFLLRYIGPLSICPTVSMLGLSLFRSAAAYGAHQWGICALTISLMVLFSQYLAHVKIPCCVFRSNFVCSVKGYPLFKMFPVMLAMLLAWGLCVVLTLLQMFPADPGQVGYRARTDTKTDVIYNSAWFRLPYPFQWGTPVVSISCVFGLLAGLLATTVESVGDYHSCARLAGAPPPPSHAINRGIFVEGMGSFIDAMFGTGNGTTSTSINVGVVGLTKVGSRVVVQVSALFMIGFGIFNKFGALFVTIPDPVIGGSFFILFGMIVAVGISNLQSVNLNSSRNMFIIGFSFLMGLALPEWIKSNPGKINTGSPSVDGVLVVLLSTNMFVGGFLGFIFDNTIPGTRQERGLVEKVFDPQIVAQQKERVAAIYDLPFCSNWLRSLNFTRHIPICPNFGALDLKEPSPIELEVPVSVESKFQK